MAKKDKHSSGPPTPEPVLSARQLADAQCALDRIRGEVVYAIVQLQNALKSPNSRVQFEQMNRCLEALERCDEQLKTEHENRSVMGVLADVAKVALPEGSIIE